MLICKRDPSSLLDLDYISIVLLSPRQAAHIGSHIQCAALTMRVVRWQKHGFSSAGWMRLRLHLTFSIFPFTSAASSGGSLSVIVYIVRLCPGSNPLNHCPTPFLAHRHHLQQKHQLLACVSLKWNAGRRLLSGIIITTYECMKSPSPSPSPSQPAAKSKPKKHKQHQKLALFNQCWLLAAISLAFIKPHTQTKILYDKITLQKNISIIVSLINRYEIYISGKNKNELSAPNLRKLRADSQFHLMRHKNIKSMESAP